MPKSVRLMERLLLLMAAVMTIGMVWNLGASRAEMERGGFAVSNTTILLLQGGFIIASLVIGFRATRRVSKWARRLLKISAVLMLANPLLNLRTITASGGWPFALFFAAAGLALLLLLRKPDSKAWFSTPSTGDGTPKASDILKAEIERRL